MKPAFLYLSLALVLILPASADTSSESLDTASMSTDQMFAQARTFAFDGKRIEARELLTSVLDRSPNYDEVRVFLGRVYAWDKDYTNARASLERVLRTRPSHTDARIALVDVELWSDNPERAIAQADVGLGFAPKDTELLFRKARAQTKIGDFNTAEQTAELALSTDPGRSDVRRLYYRILDEVMPNKVQLAYGYENFKDIDSWQVSSFNYRRATAIGSIIGRVNWANRFDDNGTQFEVDAYPGLFKKTYAYLNVGYSNSDLFPDMRYGAEVFHNFPKSWEASVGGRHLDFGSSEVTMFTGSIAKYVGNWWIAFRPNWVPDTESPDSISGGITVRRFLRGRFEYFEVTVRGGVAQPDDAPPTQPRDPLDGTFRLELNKRITKKLLFNTSGGLRRQILDSGAERDSVFLAVGLERLF